MNYTDPAAPYRDKLSTRSSDTAKAGEIVLSATPATVWWRKDK